MLTRFDRLRLLSLMLWVLPLAGLMPLGGWWLWERGWLPWWLATLVGTSAVGFVLQWWLRRRERRLLDGAETRPDPLWPPRAQAAWEAVEALAGSVRTEDWPVSDSPRLALLGRDALERVARVYHPQAEQPLLELTLPHTLMIVERACRDLRTEVAAQIPLSHRLTLGDLVRAYRWKETASRMLDLYRTGRLVFNPVGALLSEAWERLRRESFSAAWADLHRWLLQEYVRKVGYYAIELYSGRLALTADAAPAAVTEGSRADLERAATEAQARAEEPLRILVLGRANAGKSSLVNALFGRLTAPTDALPECDGAVMPYRLERAGRTSALVFDTPGCDTPALTPEELDRLALGADLVLWVTAAQRPDRQGERATLDRLRALWAGRPDHHPPPLLAAVSHIDLLRPPREWSPPYDIAAPQGTKAANIRAAVESAAADLDLVPADVIPVCLAPERVYNVTDTLWAALLEREAGAERVRLLRCVDERRRTENWTLLKRQLASAGRFLVDLPGRWLP